MWIILLSLITGGLIGFFNFIPRKIYKKLDHITTLGLICLLFFMGIKIGINQNILRGLTDMTIKSAILASGTIAGSIIMTKLYERTVLIVKDRRRVMD